MSESELRAAVRRGYDFACGYCGVREGEAGSALELDHFKPRRTGGGDELENLVYCCTTCNRLKGDFWTDDKISAHRLLHPQHDNLNEHLRQEPNGLLTALTETGSFHLARLRLNRPPLVALRQARAENAKLREELKQAQAAQKLMSERLVAFDEEIERIFEEIARFMGE